MERRVVGRRVVFEPTLDDTNAESESGREPSRAFTTHRVPLTRHTSTHLSPKNMTTPRIPQQRNMLKSSLTMASVSIGCVILLLLCTSSRHRVAFHHGGQFQLLLDVSVNDVSGECSR